MMRRTMAAAVALAALAAAGCTQSSDSAVVARVNSAKITAAEFRRQLEGLENFQMQQSVATDTKARTEFLDDLIGIELVVQEGKRLGLDRDPEYKKRQETLKKEMEQQLQNALRNDLFRSVLKKELEEKLKNLPAPTDQEVREFYIKNQDRMVTMSGKRLTFKEVEPRLKDVIKQNKQRDVYVEYTKGLRAKAKVSVDAKELDAVMSTGTATATLQLTPPAKAGGPGAAPKN